MGSMSDLWLMLEEAKLYQKHSDTSKAAAASMRGKLGPLHLKIIEYLKTTPDGATDEAMQIDLDMPPNTQRPRRRELELAGRITDSGKTAITRSGRKAVLWILQK